MIRAAVIAALALVLPVWAAALIVAVLIFIVAGVLGLLGKKNLGKVGKPEKTLKTIQDDIAWAKHPTQRR